MVIAAVCDWHERHEDAAGAVAAVDSLPSHVLAEAYSVLTRLPAGLAVPAPAAAGVLAKRFPGAPLELDPAARGSLIESLAGAGVYGGATYDGLVALEASAHHRTLLTLDDRAQVTYARLGAAFEVIEPSR